MEPIISPRSRLRQPDLLRIGRWSILDDFCYLSARVQIGLCSHVASGCSIAGGPAHLFTLGDFSSLSSGVKVWCTSDDFARDLVCLLPSGLSVKQHLITGDVTFGDYTAAGSNSVIMPDVIVPEGTVIGALSFVPAHSRLEPWSVYAGTPVRKVGERDKVAVLAQVAQLRAYLAREEAA